MLQELSMTKHVSIWYTLFIPLDLLQDYYSLESYFVMIDCFLLNMSENMQVTALLHVEAKTHYEFLEAVSRSMDAHLHYFKQVQNILPYLSNSIICCLQHMQGLIFYVCLSGLRVVASDGTLYEAGMWCAILLLFLFNITRSCWIYLQQHRFISIIPVSLSGLHPGWGFEGSDVRNLTLVNNETNKVGVSD